MLRRPTKWGPILVRLSQDDSAEPDCNLASRDSDVPGTFSEEVSHLSIRMNLQSFDSIYLTIFFF
jgi:hypothetical protein